MEELEMQIINPVFNTARYLAQDLLDPITEDILYKKGTLLTYMVLETLLSVGYEFIPTTTNSTN